MKKMIIILFLFSISVPSKAQEVHFCLQFSKKDKKSLSVKEGKEISFLLFNETVLEKGKIIKISPDSILIEQYSPPGLFADGATNFKVTSYNINEFKIIGYKKIAKVIGGTAKTILIVASTILTSGVALKAIENANTDKVFDKNIDLEEGWKIEIITCN
ncbi:MAG: hypothetical protein CO118_06845 [Flavobacteriales bacterium CG_4_9_14_3_um_filter_32_8]|nr:MAG: hypothetical protein CO118_06845 [Flavobacteriales bacterium CG_4_9_14_3_um_filter_32_8]